MTRIENLEYVYSRITELWIAKGVCEYQMGTYLDKCDSYIRGITSVRGLPSSVLIST